MMFLVQVITGDPKQKTAENDGLIIGYLSVASQEEAIQKAGLVKWDGWNCGDDFFFLAEEIDQLNGDLSGTVDKVAIIGLHAIPDIAAGTPLTSHVVWHHREWSNAIHTPSALTILRRR